MSKTVTHFYREAALDLKGDNAIRAGTVLQMPLSATHPFHRVYLYQWHRITGNGSWYVKASVNFSLRGVAGSQLPAEMGSLSWVQLFMNQGLVSLFTAGSLVGQDTVRIVPTRNITWDGIATNATDMPGSVILSPFRLNEVADRVAINIDDWRKPNDGTVTKTFFGLLIVSSTEKF